MDNPLWGRITPENCYKYHPQMWVAGVLDRLCQCREEAVCISEENLYTLPKSSEDEVTEKFLATVKEI
jgi:hypothetical protein